MAKRNKVVMSWSKCDIKLGLTGQNDAMAKDEDMFDIGIIRDKTAAFEAEEGETLEAIATGGVTVAEEEGEYKYTLTAEIIEPSFELEASLTGAELNSESDELIVKTNIVEPDYSAIVTPKNEGAVGIKIRRGHVKYKPAWGDEAGQGATISIKALECADGEIYRKFRKNN